MARYGYLICKTCNELIFLGKWLRTQKDEGIGFWHGTLCREDESDSHLLGRKALRFIAASDEGGRFEEYADTFDPVDGDDRWDQIARKGES